MSRKSTVRGALNGSLFLVIGALLGACDSPIDPPSPNAGPPARVSIRPFVLRVVEGESISVEAQVVDSAGVIVTETIPVWASQDGDVATVSQTGVVHGLRPGWTLIRASVGSLRDSVWVAVVLRFASVHVGGGHACGVTPSQVVYCWGQGGAGATTFESVGSLLTPTMVVSGASLVDAGWDHSCRVTVSGSTYCWGSDRHGQRGDGTATSPAPVVLPEPLVEISAAGFHTCGVTASERVFCWGINDTGELGIWPDQQLPSTCPGGYPCREAPVEVAGVRLRNVSAGQEHTCGLDGEGGAFCWGANESGQLGVGTTSDPLPPQPVQTTLRFRSIAAGYSRTCAVTLDRILYCWGLNRDGGLAVPGGTSCNADRPEDKCVSTPSPVETTSRFLSVSLHAAVCAISAASTLYCWGQAFSRGETITAPTPMLPDVSFSSIELGDRIACGFDSSGAVYCWGITQYTGTGLPPRNFPVMISPPGPVPSLEEKS